VIESYIGERPGYYPITPDQEGVKLEFDDENIPPIPFSASESEIIRRLDEVPRAKGIHDHEALISFNDLLKLTPEDIHKLMRL